MYISSPWRFQRADIYEFIHFFTASLIMTAHSARTGEHATEVQNDDYIILSKDILYSNQILK